MAKMADSSLLDTVQGDGLLRKPRTEGVHASTLLRKLYPVKANDITPEQLATMGMMGLAFEDRAELALLALSAEKDWPWYAERPGELCSAEGVYCSPDVLLIPKPEFPGALREASLKLTWKSCRNLPIDTEDENMFPESFDYYLGQCKFYCYVLDTTSSVLVVNFVCGDYNRPIIPRFLAWELEFSPQEIAEEYDACMSIAKGME
jgi:hypothetical protein